MKEKFHSHFTHSICSDHSVISSVSAHSFRKLVRYKLYLCALMRMNLIHIIIFLSYCIYHHTIRCEIYSSSTHVRRLVNLEKKLIQTMESFEQDDEDKNWLSQVKSQIPASLVEDSNVLYDPFNDSSPAAKYTSHPINVHALIKRLMFGWTNATLRVMKRIPSAIEIITNLTKDVGSGFPDESDVEGISNSLELLRDFYSLNLQNFNSGILPNNKTVELASSLSSRDLFEIAKKVYLKRNLPGAIEWLKASLSACHSPYACSHLISVYDYISFAEYQMGNYDMAIKYTKAWLQIEPNESRARKNLDYYKGLDDGEVSRNAVQKTDLNSILASPIHSEALKEALQDKKLEFTVESNKWEREIVKKLCSESKSIWTVPKNAEPLKCSIKNDQGFAGLFDPILQEHIFRDPEVIVFRNFINKEDMAIIKRLALDRLERATVKNPDTGLLESALYRTSKSAWLDPWEHEAVRKIHDKVERATGLTLKYSESLQVGNYGVGGFYDLHFDFSRMSESPQGAEFDVNGNRIATILIYMSDVELGGDTAFSRLGITYHPVNGDALFWYNLHSDGTGDSRTKHIACPVIYGNKWVSNYWIRMKGQEFRRPCELHPVGGI